MLTSLLIALSLAADSPEISTEPELPSRVEIRFREAYRSMNLVAAPVVPANLYGAWRQKTGAPVAPVPQSAAERRQIEGFGAVRVGDGWLAYCLLERGRSWELMFSEEERIGFEDGLQLIAEHDEVTFVWMPDKRRMAAAVPDQRGGTLKLGTAEVDVLLYQPFGRFEHPTTRLAFDLDRDGKVTTKERDVGTQIGWGAVKLKGQHWKVEVQDGGALAVLTPTASARTEAPQLSLTTASGHTVVSPPAQGRQLIMLWGTPCATCVDEWTVLEPLDRQPGLQVVGVAPLDTEKAMKPLVAQLAGRAPQVYAEGAVGIGSAYPADAWPTYVVVDHGGTVDYVGPDLAFAREQALR